MQGQTEGLPEDNAPVEGVWEYRQIGDALLPLAHPVGETIANATDCFFAQSSEKGGSLVPAFCRTYVEKTGRQAVAVSVARGATTITEWLHGTTRYVRMLGKIAGAKEKIGRAEHIYFIWLQGESDAVFGVKEDEYFQKLLDFKNDLKRDVGIDKFAIIKVGYFVSEVGWLEENTTKEERRSRDEEIMRAQERAVLQDEDFVMLTRICEQLSINSAYINPNADGHYNNLAMEIIGKTAGETLAKV